MGGTENAGSFQKEAALKKKGTELYSEAVAVLIGHFNFRKMASPTPAEILKLSETKKALEDEMDVLIEALKSTSVGLTGPLVDEDGFPLNQEEVDVYAIRHQRHRLSCLKTDYKEINKQIEDAMMKLHATYKQSNPESSAPKHPTVHTKSPKVKSAVPFALVDLVTAGSPAADANLRVGDRIVQFGSVTAENHNELRALAELVGVSIGKVVEVEVQRIEPSGLSNHLLQLTPRPWNGPGSLGCHMVPFE